MVNPHSAGIQLKKGALAIHWRYWYQRTLLLIIEYSVWGENNRASNPSIVINLHADTFVSEFESSLSLFLRYSQKGFKNFFFIYNFSTITQKTAKAESESK